MTTPTHNTRENWIDNLRGFVCIMVILVHSHIPYQLNRFITPFFLTCFFMLSGFLFKKKSVPQHLKDIFNKLVVPFGFAVLVDNLIIWFICGETTLLGALKASVYSFITGKALWFIPCLILIEIFFTLIQSIKINLFLLSIPFFLSIFIIKDVALFNGLWCLPQALFCSSYFIWGNALRQVVDIDIKSSYLIIIGVGYLILYFTWSIWGGGIALATMYNNHYDNPLQFLILSLLSSTIIFLLFKRFFKKKSKVLNIFGINSLWIFGIQSAIMVVINKNNWFEVSNAWNPLLNFLCLAIPSVIIAELFRLYAPFMTGKYKYLK